MKRVKSKPRVKPDWVTIGPLETSEPGASLRCGRCGDFVSLIGRGGVSLDVLNAAGRAFYRIHRRCLARAA